jgi:hypothetical protein
VPARAYPKNVDGIPCPRPGVYVRAMLELLSERCACTDTYECNWQLGPDAYHHHIHDMASCERG